MTKSFKGGLALLAISIIIIFVMFLWIPTLGRSQRWIEPAGKKLFDWAER